ncbi:TetR family transcriptional regulator [Solihabitans fulvus]|uniref:TetR family transcriptional regulator n=1 Tax=Solihabitans fulvus TaxID=1892852 RepID=A0A5B2WSB8_9PSEU|nr:TetR family transcriptional regulator [Solihabitans fulvus]KAA2253838.1 TetR family transcriptional regulator [Solihabitans fulvus]
MSEGEKLGLRERKKLETREALGWATVRLVVERGMDNVSVEDIAAEAGVSPRTFNNYFSSKAEAIAARHLARVRQITVLFQARPATEPLWQALTAAVVEQAGIGHGPPDPKWLTGVKLMIAERALQSAFVEAAIVSGRELAVAVAARTGTDVDRDLYPRLVAAAVGAANQVATEQWLAADPPIPLAPLLREALDQFSAGLPDPSA